MSTYNSMDQLSENPSLLSDFSYKQQNNYSKLKQHSDFLSNFIRDNNISINDNPSVESKIMETPQRSDIVGLKSGQGRSAIVSPSTHRTYQDDNKRVTHRINEESEYQQSDHKRKQSPNTIKKYDSIEENQRNAYTYQRNQNKHQYEIEEDGINRGSSNLESQNDFDGEDDRTADIHTKGNRVINEIDNMFDKMKNKYNLFPLNEMQKHLNIPDTAGNSENTSRQNFDGISQEDLSGNPSYNNQSQSQKHRQKQQDIPSFDFETNADTVVQGIRNKIMNRQGNSQGDLLQNDQTLTHKQKTQQSGQDLKERQIEIKKKLSSAGVSNKNPITEFDEQDAELEFGKLKNKVFNRNSESKKAPESPSKNESNNKQMYDKENKGQLKEELQINQGVNEERKTQKRSNNSFKHPLYSSSDSEGEDNSSKNNTVSNNKTIQSQKVSEKIQQQQQAKTPVANKDKQQVEMQGDQEIGDKSNQRHQISSQIKKSDKQPINNSRSGKLEDESIKALESISQNKINFKDNIKKLKQIFKNNFDVQKCKEEDRLEKQAQETRNERSESYNNQQSDFRIQTQSDDYHGEENNLEYSQDHQQDILFPTLNPYSLQHEDDIVGSNQNLVNNHQVDTYFYRKNQQFDNQQYNLSGDEGGDMDSEVFNISPDHHPHHDNRLNSIPDDNRTLSIFNENQSLQASFLEQSIFQQRSPRYIQTVNNSTLQQHQQNQKKNSFASSPSPILNNQIQGAIQNMQGNTIPSIQKNLQNHQQQIFKNNNTQSLTENQQQIPSNTSKQISQTLNMITSGKNHNINQQQQIYQQDIHTSFQQNNVSNLSYSQSIHDQSSMFQNDPKKFQGDMNNYQNMMLQDRILPLIEEEDERYQKIYDKDPILQKLFEERNGMELELRKWENILQELNRQSDQLQ